MRDELEKSAIHLHLHDKTVMHPNLFVTQCDKLEKQAELTYILQMHDDINLEQSVFQIATYTLSSQSITQ